MLMVWNRICCRWIAWHGTLRAWRLLPHAVTTLACVVCSGPMRALPVPAGGSGIPSGIIASPVPTPVIESWPPPVAFINAPYEIGNFPPGGVPTNYLVTNIPTGIPGTPTGVPGSPPGGPGSPHVPEPNSFMLLISGVLLIGISRIAKIRIQRPPRRSSMAGNLRVKS